MKSRKAFTLIELLVVVAIIALLISILLPSLSRARELSKRLVCGTQAKSYGTAVKIYANDNEEHWPTPTFQETTGTNILWRRSSIEIGFGSTNVNPCAAAVGGAPAKPDRQTESNVINGSGATTIAVTRAMWMLVRSGEVTPKSFICPSSGDQIENNQNVDCYYDFESSKRISYGYQVPFGPFQTRASEDIDPRMAVFSDHGPYGDDSPLTTLPLSHPDWLASDTNDPGKNMSPQAWQGFNSPNHGGRGTGEGQNVLFGDGHASFHKNPLQGIDNDNIFTLMGVNALGEARQSGISPNNTTPAGMYPGKGVFTGTIGDSTTDSLIYP
jgi:prepilin-type N-terminal cleavage/methylation domain-containing protein/prepilin-type processing-associated H-X9-DG protein